MARISFRGLESRRRKVALQVGGGLLSVTVGQLGGAATPVPTTPDTRSGVSAEALKAAAGDAPVIERGKRQVNPFRSPMLGGFAGPGVANGNMAETLGVPQPDITLTWLQDNCTWTGHLEDTFKDWDGQLVLAMGGLPVIEEGSKTPQFTWKEAAVPGGKGEQYWSKCFETLAARAPRDPAKIIYAFAHEPIQGDRWYAHEVNPGEEQDFIKAERLFYKMVQKRSPGSKVAMVMNGDNTFEQYKRIWPGKETVDIIGSTMYSFHYWNYGMNALDQAGDEFGVPKMVMEYGAKKVDLGGAQFVREITEHIEADAGTGPGQYAVAIGFGENPGDDKYALVENDGKAVSREQDPAVVREFQRALPSLADY